MKKHAGHLIFSLLIIAALTSCDSPSEQPAVTTQDAFADLPDTPPKDGICAGWQKSLAKGRRTGEVEYCLREKAIQNRQEAVEEAKLLLTWEIQEDNYSMLKPLLMALSNYPEPDSLRSYLDSLEVLPNPPGEYSRLDYALTAADYISELGNIVWFDVETGMFPNNHDYLLADAAALSELRDAEFTEQAPIDYDADDEPYQLRATFNGQHYTQTAKNFGDWYDLHAVLMLLNRMAVDQSLNSRFVTLPTGDQTAIIWVVNDQLLSQLQNEGLIRLSDVELSMQTGKAFEQEMRDKYDNVQ